MSDNSGFLKLPTEMIERLYSSEFKLPNESMRVLLFVARKTLGWGKEEDFIAESQFVETLGIKRQNVQRSIKNLERRGIIKVIRRDNKKGRSFKINEDVDSWENAISIDYITQSARIAKHNEQYYGMQSAQMQDAVSHDCKMQSAQRRTIDNIYSTIETPICPDSIAGDQDGKKGAENIKKPGAKTKHRVTDLHLSLADFLLERIRDKKPNYKLNFSNSERIKWAEHIRLMIDRDKITPERIRAVIVWAQNDSFWSSNILSTDKLRQKFDELEFKMENQSSWGKMAIQQTEASGVDYFNKPQKSIEELLK